MAIIDWQASADALLADMKHERPTETFYILTVATADGGSADMHGPYPTATETLAAWAKIHGAQDPATDFAYVLAAQANGTLVLV